MEPNGRFLDQRSDLNMSRNRRLLVNVAIILILLIILAFYFDLLKVREAGGYVLSAAAR
jgi:hypothetical protein